ncbi:MAG TPA: alpha/beta hydrolase [Rhizomicrobium sp.]|nr:alpha/beta hydrolase [Rhizomicrobium sp.]
MQTRSIESRDGKLLRTGLWDAAPGTGSRGVCVLLDGQTEFLEKYDEIAAELSARGFQVAALDWRGQGGSERLVPDPLKAHVRDFADYDGDLAAFMDQVVKPLSPKAPLVLAHSMGGHILMRALHDHPGQFAAAVATAPMMRALTRGYPPVVARAACYMENLAGQRNEWVWGMAERDPLKLTFADNLVTSDRGRFARNQSYLAAQPDIRLAGPTWGWLEAAYRSMARTMSPGFPEAIETPVLIVGAGRDQIVDTRAAREFASRLPRGTYLEFADAEHEILMENDAIRARFWKAFDGFVTKYV